MKQKQAALAIPAKPKCGVRQQSRARFQPRFSRPCVALLCACLLAGCAYHGAADIRTIPEGAEVVNVDDDTVLGQTPLKVWWQDSSDVRKRVNIRLQRDGYRDKVTSFWVALRHRTKKAALQEPQYVEVKMDQYE